VKVDISNFEMKIQSMMKLLYFPGNLGYNVSNAMSVGVVRRLEVVSGDTSKVFLIRVTRVSRRCGCLEHKESAREL